MSIHKSLVAGGGLKGHRNVLSRPERIALLRAEGRLSEEGSVFGLPKVRNIMMRAKKAKKEEKAAEGTVEGAAPAAAAPTAAAPEAAAGAKKKDEKKKDEKKKDAKK